MAFTAANQTDAHLFFILAFGAVPGKTYLGQIQEAYEYGMTTQDIVNVYMDKSQFTDIYPSSMTDAEFAAKLIDNVVGDSATDAAKDAAKSDVEAAMGIGWSRGDVIYQILNNLAAKPVTDADWGDTSKMIKNKIIVSEALSTGDKALATTDLSVLAATLAGVTKDSATVDAAIKAGADVGVLVAELQAANKAVADFATAHESEPGKADGAAEVVDKLTAAETALESVLKDGGSNPYFASDATAEQKAAALNLQKADNAKAVTDANTALAAAKQALSNAGLTAQANAAKAADAAVATATTAKADTAAKLAGAEVTADALNTATPINAVDAATGKTTVDVTVAGVTSQVDLFVVDATSKQLVLADNATAKAYKGAADLLAAINADLAAGKALTTATGNKTSADAALGAKNADIAPATGASLLKGLTDAEKAVTDAGKLAPALDKAVADVEAAQKLVDQLNALKETAKDAKDAFGDHDLNLVELTGDSSTDLTFGKDVVVLGKDFGANTFSEKEALTAGDLLYVGKSYTLNATGKLADGDNSTLEVFFKTNGDDTDVYVEQKAFGSSVAGAAAGAADILKITLTGVTAEELVFKDGFIALA